MAKTPMFDADALIAQFESASTRGAVKLRDAVSQATLQALQGRELTMSNIKKTIEAVTQAVNTGVGRNAALNQNPQALLDKALAGMDDALLRAVEANRAALQQFQQQGADFTDKHLKKALTDLERMEDVFLDTVRKAAQSATVPMTGAWNQALDKMPGATAAGTQAQAVVEQMMGQMAEMQQTMRAGRAASVKALQAMAESYSAMVGGVLLGMSEALARAAKNVDPEGKGTKR